jgi:hypothetical protein
MQLLVEHPGGPGQGLIEIKSAAGRSPLGEAEFAGFEEGAKWLVERMKLEAQQGIKEEEENVREELMHGNEPNVPEMRRYN